MDARCTRYFTTAVNRRPINFAHSHFPLIIDLTDRLHVICGSGLKVNLLLAWTTAVNAGGYGGAGWCWVVLGDGGGAGYAGLPLDFFPFLTP